MNLSAFCGEVRNLPQSFGVRVEADGSPGCEHLRDADGVEACLITAVCFARTGRLFSNKEFHEAGELLGMDWALRHLIVSCVDSNKATPDHAVLDQLLAAAQRVSVNTAEPLAA